MNRVAMRQALDIPLELQRRALETTASYVERHMRKARPMGDKYQLLEKAFAAADVRGDRLICEFGVFQGSTINHVAGLTQNTVFGFDSFEGLPEDWTTAGVGKGHFAVKQLPPVRNNVKLIKGWFHESLPPFLKEHSGNIGFLHIDCDLYSSTKIVFELLSRRLHPGSVIVFDEYFNYPGWEEGEHKAFTEFLESRKLDREFIGYHCKSQQVAAILREPN